MNMSDRHGNTIFDTSIWDDNDCVRFIRLDVSKTTSLSLWQ